MKLQKTQNQMEVYKKVIWIHDRLNILIYMS